MNDFLTNLPIDGVLLAVSGGADSMALLHMLKGHPNVQVAHVNHNIREDSMEDQLLVESFCESNGLKCHTKILTNPPMTGVEKWARDERYAFFSNVATENNIPWIATAHNANDQAETVIMKMIRGTGIKGLRGIHRVSGNIIRPMLGITKSEVYKYCEQHDVPFREDHTNADTKYFRNKVRHTMMDGLDIKQFCRIADHAQKTYPKLLDLVNRNYLSYTQRTDTSIIVDRCVPLNDLTFILFAELLNNWGINLTEDMYTRMQSSEPHNRVVQVTKSIFCDKRSKRYIKFIKVK